MSQQSKPREFLGTTDDHGHFIPLSQVESWMKDAWPNAVHVVEKSALDEARKEIERLKWEHERDCAGQVQVIDEMNEKLTIANALLEKAFKLIRKFDPEDCFIFEDGSEDLAQEVVDFIEEIELHRGGK